MKINICQILYSALALTCLSSLFVACTQDNSKNKSVPSKEKLLTCDKNREGEIWLVMDKNQEYRCIEGHWVLQPKVSSSSAKTSVPTLENVAAFLEDSSNTTSKQDSVVTSIESSSSLVSSSSLLIESSSSVFSSSSKTLIKDSTTINKDSARIADSLKNLPCATVPEGTTCDKRDGKIYPLTKIGSQIWFAKNLNYKVPNSYCYEDNSENCVRYGRLYEWTSAMNLDRSYNAKPAGDLLNHPMQGVCPDGFHIPSSEDFQVLSDYVSAKNEGEGVGTSLKKPEGWEEIEDIPQGTDKFGFAGLPAGFKHNNGSFNLIGSDLSFWISEEASSGNQAPYWNLYAENDKFIGTYVNNKKFAYSVRCIKNKD